MDLLKSVINDNQSGSAELVNKTMNLLKTYLQEKQINSENLRNTLYHVIEVHNQMAILYHFIDGFIDVIYNNTEDLQNKGIEFIEQYRIKYKSINIKIAEELLKTIRFENKKILIHSNSSTIVKVFLHLKDKAKEISFIQTESRPSLEGRIQAQKLAGAGYKVRLIVDSAVYNYLNEVDYIILGADAILQNSFINKIGSYGIALGGKQYGKSIYVLADGRKITGQLKYLDDSNLKKENQKSATEIWNENHKNIFIENYYFEEILNDLVTEFITG